MLSHIVMREVSDHLKSLRFVLIFTMVTILFAVSAMLFVADYKTQASDYDQNRNEMMAQISDRAARQGGLFYIFSFNFDSFWVHKRPNHMGFISEGQERNLPNAFQPSAFRVYGPAKQVRSNILLWRSEALDWALIIGVILSFAALVLVYDRISGGKEQGTLRLNLSNSVSRSTILFGKFLGALACLGSAMAVGMAVSTIIVALAGGAPIRGYEISVVLSVFVLSMLYISVFLMLGLFVSSLVSESATSLVISLMCWSFLVIVIPRSSGFIAARIEELPTWTDARSEALGKGQEAKKSYEENYPEGVTPGSSGHWSPGEPLERALVQTDAWSESFDEYRYGMINQVEIARNITLVSPYAGFTTALEILAESGVVHYKSFFRQVQNYRLAMKQHLQNIYTMPLKYHRWSEEYKTPEYNAKFKELLEPVDFESIPKFEEKRSDVTSLVNDALPYVLQLVVFYALFLACAFVSFMRYDVR